MRTFSDIARVVAMVLLGYLTIGALNVNSQVQLPPYYKPQFLDQNGRPLSNGCVFTYISGTNTPQATFTDFTGSTPNPNPIQLDGSGRPPLGTDIWLGSGSYRFKLVSQGGSSCSTGIQQWLEDGITSSSGTILASNNTFTGTNTFDGTSNFNGPVNMNVGFTSNGPSNLADGGSLAGTFSGSPIFSGTPVFDGGFTINGITTFNGTVILNGNPPMTVLFDTEVTMLNVNFLQGGTWATPLAIGSITPMNGTFTGLHATTNFQIASSVLIGGIQGVDTSLLSSGTVSGAPGTALCIDANGGATTVACAGGGFSRISLGTTGSVCTTSSSAGATCSTVVTIAPTQADTSYVPSCMGISITGAPYIVGSTSLTTTSIAVTISNGQGSQAVPSTYGSLACSAIHP
jgi:hypothetical protein